MNKCLMRVKKNWVEWVFLLLFVCVLFVPMHRITREDFSVTESRNLAVAPEVVKDGKFNFSFPGEFDNYFKDRFFGRIKILDLYACVMNRLINDLRFNEKILVAKDGYLFNTDNHYCFSVLPKDWLASYRPKLKRLKTFCEQNNIELYFQLDPTMEDVYRDNYFPQPKNERGEQAFQFLKDLGINVIYPKESLLLHKDETFLFFKTDGHFTDEGAYIAYLDVIDAFSKDFTHIVPVDESTFLYSKHNYIDFEFVTYHFRGWRLNCRADYEVPYYTYIEVKDKPYTIEVDKDARIKTTHCEGASPYKLVHIGTSYGDQLSEYFINSFEDYIRIRSNYGDYLFAGGFAMSRFEQMLIDEKPDILLLNMTDFSVYELEHLYPEEK